MDIDNWRERLYFLDEMERIIQRNSITSKSIADAMVIAMKEAMNLDDAARYIGVSKATLYRWTMEKKITHYKGVTGRRVFFKRDDVIKFMLANMVKSEE